MLAPNPDSEPMLLTPQAILPSRQLTFPPLDIAPDAASRFTLNLPNNPQGGS